jgi:hypothetical protein
VDDRDFVEAPYEELNKASWPFLAVVVGAEGGQAIFSDGNFPR